MSVSFNPQFSLRCLQVPKTLHGAIQQGDPLQKVLSLITPTNINQHDTQGLTPLHCAILTPRGDRPGLILGLIQKGADVNALTGDGRTSLYLAITGGNVEEDDDMEGGREEQFNTQIEDGRAEVIQLLLKYGAVTTVDEPCGQDGRTVLHFAAERDWLVITQHLVEGGADVNVLTSNNAMLPHCNTTPLYFAVEGGCFGLVEYLLNQGAAETIDWICCDTAWTALHMAAMMGYTDIASLLVTHGADTNITTPDGQTPIDLADHHGQFETANILLGYGVIERCTRTDSESRSKSFH